MPYIKKSDRELLQNFEEGSLNIYTRNPGDLNYMFTILVDHYLEVNGLNYQHINDCIGALEGAKLELYRRVAGNYEDKKIQENGDVYSTSLTKGKGK